MNCTVFFPLVQLKYYWFYEGQPKKTTDTGELVPQNHISNRLSFYHILRYSSVTMCFNVIIIWTRPAIACVCLLYNIVVKPFCTYHSSKYTSNIIHWLGLPSSTGIYTSKLSRYYHSVCIISACQCIHRFFTHLIHMQRVQNTLTHSAYTTQHELSF